MPRPREHKIVHAVSCQVCGADAGEFCRVRDAGPQPVGARPAHLKHGRPLVHSERKRAWQEWKRTHAPDYLLRTSTTRYTVLQPTGERQSAALFALYQDSERREDGAVRVPHHTGDVLDVLAERGWHVERQ